jgi:branched-chain amino acid transport system substrate-binding protein
LFSASGVTAVVEQTQRAATLLAINQINAAGGVLGRLIEPVSYDPGSDPEKYRELAKRLCDEDKVKIIFGCKMSSARKAVLPIVEARDVLLFYPTPYEGFEYTQHCIYTGAAPNQNSVQLVEYLASHYGTKVFLLGSNYIYPHESNRVVGGLFKQMGGSVLDEMYFPLDVEKSELARAIDRISQVKPDVIYSSLVGEGIAYFYDAYHKAGFDPGRMPIGSLSTSEAEIAQMRRGAAQGHILSATYFSTLKSAENDQFLSAFSECTGSAISANANAEAAYFQVFLYARALENAGTDDLQTVLQCLYEVEVVAPQGPVKVDSSNNHTHLWPRVARVDAAARPIVVHDPGKRVQPDPFMVGQHLDTIRAAKPSTSHRGDRAWLEPS